MDDVAVAVRDLQHTYRGATVPVEVLVDVDLDVDAGSFVAVTGPSGSGKSTLLALLGALERPQHGSVVICGRDLSQATRNELADFRRATVGFVFQHFGLLDTLTAVENVALAATLAGAGGRDARSRARSMLRAVGLDDRLDHPPNRLSGGERQRVAIARALVNAPRLVLADEPTGNLDIDSTALVMELLRSVPTRHGCSVVLVTHDATLAAQADRGFRLERGRLEPSAAPAANVGGPSGARTVGP